MRWTLIIILIYTWRIVVQTKITGLWNVIKILAKHLITPKLVVHSAYKNVSRKGEIEGVRSVLWMYWYWHIILKNNRKYNKITGHGASSHTSSPFLKNSFLLAAPMCYGPGENRWIQTCLLRYIILDSKYFIVLSFSH